MRTAYSGISGRIGRYIDEYRSTDSKLLDRSIFNWEDSSTYKSLNSYDRVFLSFPVNKINVLKLLPEFLPTLRADQTIVKFGSLGPQHIIHDLIDAELRTRCRVINLRLAPTMQNIMDEQIEGEYLCDYRYGRPAPYVAPEDAAALAVKAVESTVTGDDLAVTSTENLTIRDVQALLKRYRYYQIKNIDPSAFVDQYRAYGKDLVKQIADAYESYKTWNPEPSSDLADNEIYPLTFEQWLEKHYDN